MHLRHWSNNPVCLPSHDNMGYLPFILSVIIIFYLAFVLAMTLLWFFIPVTRSKMEGEYLNFSVLVPFRNESGRIGSLLDSLQSLDYPTENFEIIFINDHSTDNTVSKLEGCIRPGMNWRVIHAPSGAGGKKRALQLGVDSAQFDHIVTTDADCSIGKEWLNAYNQYYRTGEVVFVSAPLALQFDPGSFTGVLQHFEQTALTAMGAVSMSLNKPTMCNGANLSFKKAAFQQVDGYRGNDHIPTGDDQFLLAKMNTEFPGKTGFLKSRDAVVTTPAIAGWSPMIEQRIRWASKWRATGRNVMLSAIFVGLTYISLLLLALTAIFFDPSSRSAVIILFSVKIFMDAIFVKSASYNDRKWVWLWWPVVQVVYPFYIIFVAVRSSVGTYSWKGRQYSAVG